MTKAMAPPSAKGDRMFQMVFITSITILFFGILHMNLVQGIYAFAVGLVLGYVAGKCRTVFLPILLHLCFNIAGTVLAALLSGNTGWLMQGILTVAGVLMLTGAFLLVQKEMKNL